MKRIIAILIIFIIAGCSSTIDEQYTGYDNSLINDQTDVIESNIIHENDDIPILYEKANEWEDVDPFWDNAIQVDDLFFKDYMKVSDLLTLLDESDNIYTFPNNKDELLSPGQFIKVKITRTINDEKIEWINLAIENIYEQTITIEQAVVVNFYPTNNALPYSRIFDGRSYNEVTSISFNEAKDYLKELESSLQLFSWKEENSNDGKYINLIFTVFKDGTQSTWKKVEIDGITRYLNTTNAFVFLKSDPSNVRFEHIANFSPTPSYY